MAAAQSTEQPHRSLIIVGRRLPLSTTTSVADERGSRPVNVDDNLKYQAGRELLGGELSTLTDRIRVHVAVFLLVQPF